MRKFAVSFAVGLASAAGAAALAQSQAPAGPYAFKQGYPTADAAQRARDDADYQRALVAYRFWYPAVSNEGIFNGNRAVGIEDGKAMGIAAAGPGQVGFTLNSDTPYGSAVIDVSNGPVVIALPAGAYIGLVDDHYQGWVLDMGLPGPDAGKGGEHLVVPPGYTGTIPSGYHVGHSKSLKNLLAVRALPVDGNVEKAMDALRAIKIYPLSSAADPNPIRIVDTTQMAMDSSCLKWEDNIQFWQVLKKIVDAEPAVPEFLPMYALLAEVGVEKGRPFEPDARMKAILERAAKDGRDQLLVSAFASTRPDRINWPDRKWEWVGLVPGSAQFEAPGGGIDP